MSLLSYDDYDSERDRLIAALVSARGKLISPMTKLRVFVNSDTGFVSGANVVIGSFQTIAGTMNISYQGDASNTTPVDKGNVSDALEELDELFDELGEFISLIED